MDGVLCAIQMVDVVVLGTMIQMDHVAGLDEWRVSQILRNHYKRSSPFGSAGAHREEEGVHPHYHDGATKRQKEEEAEAAAWNRNRCHDYAIQTGSSHL